MRKRIMLKMTLSAMMFLSVFSVNANAAFVTLTGTITETPSANLVVGALVTAYPTISCGSWTGTAALTDNSGHYSMSVPDDCNFYIYPTRKDYTFDPVYYYVTPETVNDDFDFVGIYD